MARLGILALFAAVVVGATACDDACSALSKQVCECESTQNAQRACLERVSNEAGKKVLSTADLEACEALEESCTCDALANGDLAACGLALE